jgi:phage FluMu protein Com
MPKIYTTRPTDAYQAANVQIEARCPECNKLLFAYSVQSHAVLETVCPRCHKTVRAEVYPDDAPTPNSEIISRKRFFGAPKKEKADA